LVKVVESYVNKGKEIAVEGKLTSRSYETKDGEKRFITEIVCNDLVLLSK
jgi:single-strand DNA-binding protein